MDSEMRDAERNGDWGRWRVLRDRACSDMLPIKHSSYPKWIFWGDYFFFVTCHVDEVLFKLAARHQWTSLRAHLLTSFIHDEMMITGPARPMASFMAKAPRKPSIMKKQKAKRR